jgi:hypothetical protein
VRLSPFRKPYPDELLFSTICRSWEASSFPQKAYKKMLQGKRKSPQTQPYCHPLFPVPTDRLLSLLPKGFLTESEIIEHHSVLPFYRPFAKERPYKNFLKRAKFNLIGQRPTNGHFQKVVLRFCPACAQEDKERKRRPYLRSLHQVHGYWVCHLHKVGLAGLEKRTKSGYGFDSLQQIVPGSVSPSSDVPENLYLLARDIASIPATFSGIQSHQIWQTLRFHLTRTWGTNFVQQTLSEIAQTMATIPDVPIPTVKRFGFTSYRTNFRERAVPFVLAIIRWMGESPESFAAAIKTQSTTLKSPCFNQHCSLHRRVLKVDLGQILPNTKYRLIACPQCSYVAAYNPSKYRDKNPRYGVPYSVGKMMPELQKLWDDSEVPFYTLTKQFGISPRALLRIVHFQSLSLDRNGLLEKFWEVEAFRRTLRNEQETIEEKKKILTEALAKDPDLLLTNRKGSKEIYNARNRLNSLDPVWLHAFLNKLKEVRKVRP